MDYFDVKAKSEEIKSRLHSLDQDFKTVEQERTSLMASIKELEANHASDRKRQEQADREAFVRKSCRAVEEKLAAVRSKIDALEKEHEAFVREFQETYDQKLKEAESLIEISTLEEQIQETMQYATSIMSDRFFTVFEAQMDSQSDVQLDSDDLLEAVDYFDSVNRRLSHITQNTCNKVIERVIEFFACMDPAKISSNSKIFVFIVFLVFLLIFVLAKKVAPFIVLFLFALCMFNLARSYLVHLAVLSIKTVKDNMAKITDTLHQNAVSELEEEQQQELAEYERVKNTLQIREDKLQKLCEKTAAESGSSFIFDDSKLQKEYSAKRKQLEERNAEVQKKAISISTQIHDLQADNLATSEKLATAVDDVVNSYLDPSVVGSSFVFDTKFLLGIADNDVKYFDFPSTHCLFAYTDSDVALQFIRLIIYQIRKKLDPSVFSTFIYDTVRGGDTLTTLVPNPSIVSKPEKQAASELAFAVYVTKEQIDTSVKKIAGDLQGKQQKVTRQYRSINEYNQVMVQTDSLPMEFVFLFVLVDDLMIASSEQMQQIYKIGDKVGVYVFLFLDKTTLVKKGQQGISLLEQFKRCYDLTSSGVSPVATSYLQSSIKK